MEERAWYIIQTYSGLENAAKTNIERRIKSMNMDEFFFQVLVDYVLKHHNIVFQIFSLLSYLGSANTIVSVGF